MRREWSGLSGPPKRGLMAFHGEDHRGRGAFPAAVKPGWKPPAPEAQGFLRHGNQRRVRRVLRRGPRGVADGELANIPAPPDHRSTLERDAGTKRERLCGRPFKPVGASREVNTRGSLRANPSHVESAAKKSSSRESVGCPYRKPTQVGEASSLR